MGYDVYLKAARLALFWVKEYTSCDLMTEQRPKFFSFVLSAVSLMCALRHAEHITSTAEATLLINIRNIVLEPPSMTAISRTYHDALRAAYDRFEASGEAERRGMELAMHNVKTNFHEFEAKGKADSAARGLQSCAHCGAVKLHVAQFKRCSACKAVVFCSKDCQLANWPAHKAACKAARKAAAGAAAGE
jgi:hypothetical protein